MSFPSLAARAGINLPNATTGYKVHCKNAWGLCSQVLRQETGAGKKGDQAKLYGQGNRSGLTVLAGKHSQSRRPEAEEILCPVLCRRSD